MALVISVLFSLLFVITVFSAEVYIDAFSAETQNLSVDTNNATDGSYTAHDSSIMGLERDATLELISGTSTCSLDINAGSSGVVAFSAGSGSQLKAVITWDGDDDDADTLDPTGLGGIDLEDSTNDGIIITVYDWEGNSIDLTLTIYTDASNYSTAVLEMRGGGTISPPGQDYALSFDDDFVDTGSGANLTNVGAIVLEIETASSGADISVDLTLADTTRDFGDLPSDYGITTESNNGARHTKDAVYFGTVIDTELDGVNSSGADGDNNAVSDDEEGVIPTGKWANGTDGGEVQISVNSPQLNQYACVDGWIDWNDDNDFDDSLEHVIDSLLLYDLGFSNNLNQTFDVPANTFSGTGTISFYTRWRIEPDSDGDGSCADEANMNYTGYITGGEVEDYLWEFNDPTAVTITSLEARTPWLNPALMIPLAGALIAWAGYVLYRSRKPGQ